MLFAITALDYPDCQRLRAETRPAHLEYVQGAHAEVTLKVAGPLLDTGEQAVIGSLLIVDAADAATVERFATNDPYRQAGLFEHVEIRRWNMSLGSLGA